jgi:hypothetical protein
MSFIIQNDAGHGPGPDYGESTLRLKPTPGTMTVVDFFTPFDFKARDDTDTDVGSSSVTLLPTFPGTAHPNLAVETDKSGTMRLIDVDNMGGINPGGPDRVLQEFTANPKGKGLIYSSPVFFNGKIYIQGVGDVIKAFALKLDPATNTMMIDETPVSQGTSVSDFPGEVQSVSADGASNGIVWSPQVDQFSMGGPATLRAYNANDLSKPLYSSDQAGSRDTAGGAVRFVTPTIANGMVYLGAQFEVDAYGLLSQASSVSQPGGTPAATHRIARPRSSTAGTHAGPATMRISRGAAVVPRSGMKLTALNDLAVSQLDGDNGFMPLPGLRKNRWWRRAASGISTRWTI